MSKRKWTRFANVTGHVTTLGKRCWHVFAIVLCPELVEVMLRLICWCDWGLGSGGGGEWDKFHIAQFFLYVLALQSLKSNQRWKYRNSDDDLMSLLTKTLCFRLRSSHKDEQFHTSLWMKIQRNQCWLTCEQAFGHPDEGKLHFKRRTGHSRPESCGLWCLHHFHGVNLSLRTRPGYVSA